MILIDSWKIDNGKLPGVNAVPAKALRFAPGRQPSDKEQPMTDLTADPSPAAILIVDDEETIQQLVTRILEEAGYATQIASNGREGLDRMRTGRFDLVISDIGMPVMDGLTMTEEVVRTYETDVIIMTGKITRYSYDQVISIGASDYIQKPFTPEELTLRVERVFRERRLKQEAIRHHEEQAQSQHLESIGQLAAGIAHEINTPIQYIGDNTTFIRESFQDLDQMVRTLLALFEAARKGRVNPDMLNRVEAAVEETDFEFVTRELPVAIDQTLEGVSRIKEIIKAMKDFSHPGDDGHVAASVNQCIQSTATISKAEWKYVADLELDLDPGLPEIRCNPGELNQVFLNLIVNAGHAIADHLRDRPSEKGKIKIRTRWEHGNVVIKVSDTGAGIPGDIVDKIFDPFFTTKEIGRGTGQGLAITRAIVVNRHHGQIKVHTAPGRGTTFTLTIPESPIAPT